ncbi:hypothetical protein SAMN05443637_112172 [Pseudonocardia thermophila]|jgi:hypothetical protein|uniref:Uncharacterized protein n=1 Tax=Pseudonocardia thermophila TaxID=1848 RepID=A0A1M6VJV2_PSETH|nr:hypothetical protein [Pseudonocardia thermophila]SHK81738.1 hypothetical protein SAMN05443637_112172 [Pseudonocardia thermophila]
MTDTAQYLTLVFISVVLTVAVGIVLMRAGEPFLLEVFHDRKVTRSLNLLLFVLFLLITLGVLAIISAMRVDTGNSVQTFIVKLGVVLLTLGVAYGISMLVLLRVRAARRAAEIHENVTERLAEREYDRIHRDKGRSSGV